MNPGQRAALGSLLLAVAVAACGSSGGRTADAAADGADAADAASPVDVTHASDTADAAAICNNCGMVGMMAGAGSCTFSIPCPPGDFSRLFVFEEPSSAARESERWSPQAMYLRLAVYSEDGFRSRAKSLVKAGPGSLLAVRFRSGAG